MSNRLRLMDLGWVLTTNLFVLAGVVAWGWPPGNVFVLFWIENVILGVVTAVRIATAQGHDAGSTDTAPRWARTAFFVVHYGIFALVHGVFATFIAYSIGLAVTIWTLGMPALLIALRYVLELATGWFRGQQRRSVTPDQAFAAPYPRLIVLHLATLLGFAAALSSAIPTGVVAGTLAPVLQWLSGLGIPVSNGVLVVALLMLLKTVAEVAVLTRRAPLPEPRPGVRDGSLARLS